MLWLKDIIDLNSMLSVSDEEPGAQRGRDIPKTAQQISAELGPELRVCHALGRTPLWKPILGIWYINICVIIPLKAIS